MAEWSELAERLNKILKLEVTPIAIKLIRRGEQIPEGVEEYTGDPMPFCGFVGIIREEGKVLFSRARALGACPLGLSALGFSKTPEKVMKGEADFEAERFVNLDAARRKVSSVQRLSDIIGPGMIEAVLAAPLDKTPVDPDIIHIFGSAYQMMRIVQGSIYKDGGKAYAEFAGMQATCSDATVVPLITNRPNFTVQCVKSRMQCGCGDWEMLAGIPGTRFEEVVAGVEKTEGKY
jgi:uncharacterized protein (DUF169 family)